MWSPFVMQLKFYVLYTTQMQFMLYSSQAQCNLRLAPQCCGICLVAFQFLIITDSPHLGCSSHIRQLVNLQMCVAKHLGFPRVSPLMSSLLYTPTVLMCCGFACKAVRSFGLSVSTSFVYKCLKCCQSCSLYVCMLSYLIWYFSYNYTPGQLHPLHIASSYWLYV